MKKYGVAHIDGLDRIHVAGVNWRPIRRRFDIRAFGVNAYTADTGEHVVEEHTELANGHEELYVVATGAACFTVDGEETEAPAGTLVFISDPAARRGAVARSDGTTVVGIGGKPGEAFTVSAWEYYFAAEPAYNAKDFVQAYAIASEGLAHVPDSGPLHYQLACYAALGGDDAKARDHLSRAFELDEKTRKWAEGDSDLDSLRGRPPL